jgi:Bacterial membrane protein YfhO
MSQTPSARRQALIVLLLLTAILTALFYRSFLPDYVHFSNDGPLGAQKASWIQLPAAFTGVWVDLNDVGFGGGAWPIDINSLCRWFLGAVGYAKFFPPVTLLILGMSAWIFFRQLKLSPAACALGALAAALNNSFFSIACWGVSGQLDAFSMDFLALALVLSNSAETTRAVRWIKNMLAGFCVGLNVMEAADIGALFSIWVAGFVFYDAVMNLDGAMFTRVVRGIGRVATIAIFAGFIATQTVVSLVGTQIQGIAGTAQDSETKLQHWDWATQWSLPKTETLSVLVPGLFGYKMDTPKDMMPQFQKSFEGGAYWGGVGRDPNIDRYLDAGSPGQQPSGFMRFTGGNQYCGVLVCLIAAWAVAQALRRKDSAFSDRQKKHIWFWGALLVISMLMAWGRFAPLFYGTLYKLPYFSTIRNPTKFLIFFCWATVILFTYGVHALSQRYLLENKSGATSSFSRFDRKWFWGCAAAFGASVIGWLIFSSEQNQFVAYLQKIGFPDENFARQIAAFSLGQLGWFVGLLAVALVLLTLVLAGYFTGTRARLAVYLFGAFLFFDLGRANLPYIVHWDYKQKYEVGSLNPVVDFLRNKPYEHRVAGLPFRAPEGMELFDQLYRIEWMQHHFLYYDIQCLDIIQMPRMPEDLKSYLEAISPRGTQDSAWLFSRRWELSNTRYLLGPAGYLEVMNQQIDPEQHRFRFVQRFEVVPKPGILQPQRLEELTAVPNENGRYALIEFTGALPRAKLYSNWLVNTNDRVNLQTLADKKFDPAKTVLVSTPQPELPAVATNTAAAGTVEFKSYSPKHIVFEANAATPAVMLLNDKFDAGWHVTVDGKPAALLRCNYLMRGVPLPAGKHTVVFSFFRPDRPLYVTLAGLATAFLLAGMLVFLTRKKQTGGSQ